MLSLIVKEILLVAFCVICGIGFEGDITYPLFMFVLGTFSIIMSWIEKRDWRDKNGNRKEERA